MIAKVFTDAKEKEQRFWTFLLPQYAPTIVTLELKAKVFQEEVIDKILFNHSVEQRGLRRQPQKLSSFFIIILD